jgi:hypothetical protein
MSKKSPSKDEALEALDFIVNVLKEHEKDLDKLINELGTVTEQLGVTGELSTKVEKVEQRITALQNEISSLVGYLSTSRGDGVASPNPEARIEVTPAVVPRGQPVLLRCKQWEDFVELASQADTVSFLAKEAERTFQVDALKGSQIITFSGEIPKLTSLLRVWLSKQLNVSEKKMLEGALAIS